MSSAVHPVLQSLAIELSQRDGSVLVRAADGRESVRQFASGRRDQDALLPAIDDATHSLDKQPSGFQLLAVDIGPGGFTGLRVSIATIQGIAEVSGADVVGIDGAIVAAASTPQVQDCDGDGPTLSLMCRFAFHNQDDKKCRSDWKPTLSEF